jgi:MtaA/CmuA family methyltransferase
MTGKERILAAVRGESVDQVPMVPISMMIAADTTGVPYRTYATDWRELVRGQLAFAEKFGIDHVSVISDPATEAADCGAEVSWHDHQPPALPEENSLIREKETLSSLRAPDPSTGPRMSNRVRAVEELAAQAGAEKLIEGWVEGPIAEACDLRGINRVMMDFFDDPEFVNDLLEFVFEMEMEYARVQIAAGAEIIGVGDAAASLLGPDLYEEFAFPFHRRYIERIHEMGAMVRLHICGDSRPVLPLLSQLRPDIMDLDSIAPVADARRYGGPTQVLTGNIDPVRILKEGTPETVTAAIDQCFRDAGSRAYLVAAGCEIPRGTPDANLFALGAFARDNRY